MPSAGLIIHLCIRLLLQLSDDAAAVVVPSYGCSCCCPPVVAQFPFFFFFFQPPPHPLDPDVAAAATDAVVVRSYTHTSIRATITAAQWPSSSSSCFLSSLQSLNSQRMQKFSLPPHTHTRGCKAFLDSFIPQEHRSAPNTRQGGLFSGWGKQLSLTSVTKDTHTHL